MAPLILPNKVIPLHSGGYLFNWLLKNPCPYSYKALTKLTQVQWLLCMTSISETATATYDPTDRKRH